jgi:hypothetical protein
MRELRAHQNQPAGQLIARSPPRAHRVQPKENTMTQYPETRRHLDGSINFDFYRAQAVAARGGMLRDAFKLKATFGFALITLALIVCVTIAASMPKHWA